MSQNAFPAISLSEVLNPSGVAMPEIRYASPIGDIKSQRRGQHVSIGSWLTAMTLFAVIVFRTSRA
jgi:hypothetical protein